MRIAIVGAGLYGATLAHLFKGHEVCVFEKSEFTGGNVRTVFDESIGHHVSVHGAHIFHTNSAKIWNFVNQFTGFNNYHHYVKGQTTEGSLVDLPFGMSLFSQVLGLTTPSQVQEYFRRLSDQSEISNADTVESWCLTNIGKQLYETVVKNYTEKQWGRPCSELSADIIRRLPLRLTYDNTYFNNANFQGMPILGYQHIIDQMLSGTQLFTGWSVGLSEMVELHRTFDRVFFSGPLDQLFDYDDGVLPYRGLAFENTYHDCNHYLGMPVLNDLSNASHTRRIEHKLFYPEKAGSVSRTLVTTEYPRDWDVSQTPYYPVRNDASSVLHLHYLSKAAEKFPKLTVGGRLGSFRYYDMDQVIGMAMADSRKVYRDHQPQT